MVVSLRLPVLAAGAVLVAAAVLLAPAAGSVGAVLSANTWRLPVPDLELLKGADPKAVSPDDDKENLGPDPPPPPVIVHTTTVISYVPTRIEKGTPFVVEGNVTDEDGEGVAGAPIDVYLNQTKDSPGLRVAKGKTAEDGHFAIHAEVPPALAARDYQVVAAMRDHVEGRLLYLESWSDPPTSVFSDTRMRMRAPSQAAINEKIKITGVLEDVTGGPVREVLVTLVIDGQDVATTTTGADGSFLFTHMFRGAGSYDVVVRYLGSANYGASEDDKVVNVGGNGLDISTARTTLRNETFVLAGTLTVDAGAPAGWVVDVAFVGIDLGGNSTLRLTTDESGEFRAEVFVPPTAPLGSYEIRYDVPTLLLNDTAPFQVQAQTQLVLGLTRHVRVGEAFQANATLVDDLGVPMAGRIVDLRAGELELTGFTDDNGTVRWTAEIPGGSYRGAASYSGDALYRGSDAVVSFAVDLTFAQAATGFIATLRTFLAEHWPWLSVLAFLLVLAGWAAHPKGRRMLQRGLVVLDPRAPVALTLDLPGIEVGLPDVWGVGDHLGVIARAAGREGAPLPSLPLTIEAGSIQRLTTDSTGRVRTEVTFIDEGTCTVVASFAGDRRFRAATVEREVRVVDYRRAIEEGFEDLRHMLASRGVPVHGATPPRELERRIHETIPALSQDDLDRLLTLFEIADYSEHAIDRAEWVAFERAHAALRAAVPPDAPAKRRLFGPREAALVE